MIKEDLRAFAKELVGFHKRFVPYFGGVECQDHAFHYLRGLLLAPRRKSVEPMALQFAQGSVVPMQRFLTRGCQEAADVQREVQAVAAQRLTPSASGSSVEAGVPRVHAGTRFAPSGRSAREARAHPPDAPPTTQEAIIVRLFWD